VGVDFAESKEGEEARKAFSLGIDAAGSTVKDVSKLWGSVSKKLSEEMPQEGKETGGALEYVQNAFKTVQKTFASPEVKDAVEDISTGAKKTGKEASLAARLLFGKVASDISESEKRSNASRELLDGIGLLFQVSRLTATRLTSSLSKELPENKQ
jgi:gas vesicle protein